MPEDVGPLSDPRDDTWALAAIEALCATLQRRAIDRLANVREDRQETAALLRFLTLAGEALQEQETLEEALACLEKAGGDTEARTLGASGDGDCRWPWVWDPVLEMCVLPG